MECTIVFLSFYSFVISGLLYSFCIYSKKQKNENIILKSQINHNETKYVLFEDDNDFL